MNVKIIIALVIVVAIIAVVWYWYGAILSPNSQYGSSSPKKESAGQLQTSADSTTAISGDLNRVPDDSPVQDSVDLTDSSVSSF